MLRSNEIRFENFGLQIGNLQRFFRLFGKWDISQIGCFGSRGTNYIFDALFQAQRIDVQHFYRLYRFALSFADDPQKQMLAANIIMPQPDGFFPAVLNHFLYSL